MIGKIETVDGVELNDAEKYNLTGSAIKKINRLIDQINKLDPIVQNLVNTSIEDGNRLLSLRDSLDAIKNMVNVHEKEIDKLQMLVEPEKCDYEHIPGVIKLTTPMNLQENWIGHLCRFYDDDDKFCFGLLSEIDKGSIYPYCCAPSGTYWEHCEPIKPDAVLLFKGDKDVIQ